MERDEKIGRRTFIRRMIGLSDQEGGPSLLNTVGISTAFAFGLIATAPLAAQIEDSTKIKLGSSEQIGNPLGLYLVGSVVSPLWEEGLFRILPSFLLPKRWGMMWSAGFLSSIIFAEAHALEIDDQTIQIRLDSNAAPLYQFGMGLFLWKIVRERGYLHAIVAHSTINTVFTTLSLTLTGLLDSQHGGKASRNP